MVTFADLKFTSDGFMNRARHAFPNGYEASVIIGRYSYGGDEGKYELAVCRDGHCVYDTGLTDDVIGHLEPDEVTALLAKIEALPPHVKL